MLRQKLYIKIQSLKIIARLAIYNLCKNVAKFCVHIAKHYFLMPGHMYSYKLQHQQIKAL